MRCIEDKSLDLKSELRREKSLPDNDVRRPIVWSFRFDRFHGHELTHRSFVEKLDATADLGEKRIVFAAADVETGLHASASLPHDDRPSWYNLPAERLEPQPLCVGVAAVS
jgi:hypothetical protein